MTTYRFIVPESLLPTGPPESRGLRRDEVRLLVARPDRLDTTSFLDLAKALEPGDLLVVNTSATLPAALDARREDGSTAAVHLATVLDDGTLVVELRRDGRVHDGIAGERLVLPGGGLLRLVGGYPDPAVTRGSRLWTARPALGDLLSYLRRYGRPISYGAGAWPLEAYQSIFARPPRDAASASSEMPSAGRPFSPRVLQALSARGVRLATLALHTGVSSLEVGELPLPERFRVPATTARAVEVTRAAGRRIVAVGTTVARALETVAGSDGAVTAGRGVTDLVLGPERPARIIGGLITGWHDPDASHLLLLEAVAGPDLVCQAYTRALADGLLWHEFGDSCLLLP